MKKYSPGISKGPGHIPPVDLSKLIPEPEVIDILTISQKTIDIFSGITNKRIILKNTKEGPYTDGISIYVPWTYKYLYEAVEHELSHILFKSDGNLKAEFCRRYVKYICMAGVDEGFKLNDEAVMELINYFFNIIEDHRVSSLWEQLYPGSYRLYRIATKRLIADVPPHESLIGLFLHVEVGNQVVEGPLSPYIDDFKKALLKIKLRGPEATPLVVKWLITVMVKDIIVQTNEPELVRPRRQKIESLQELLEKYKGPSLSSEIIDHLSDIKDTEHKLFINGDDPLDIVNEIMGVQVKDERILEARLEPTKKEMSKIIEHAKDILIDSVPEYREASVGYRDIEGISKSISNEDSRYVDRLRSIFYKLKSKKISGLDYSGSEIDTSAMIERITSNQNIPVFKTELRGRGFKALILIDRSGSMEGIKSTQVERACQILRRSLSFPFVNLKVWGFMGTKPGVVEIQRFKGEDLATSEVGGSTPLHIAIKVALNELEKGFELKQLFILSDGMPSFQRFDKSIISGGVMMKSIYEDVRNARIKGIGVTALMIKDKEVDQIQYSTMMFGNQKYWSISTTDSLGEDLVEAVSNSFRSYLGTI